MIQDVFIIGATGKVGKTLVSQIFEKGDTDKRKHKNPTRIIGLASSKSFIHSKHGLSEDICKSFSKKESEGSSYGSPDDLLGIQFDDNVVFVDATANREEMKDFHLKVIEETPHGIVTANKNPIAHCDMDTFNKLIRNVGRYGFRCSVMAGAEAVNKVRDLKDLGDEVLSIEGCFSGTLGYISTELEKGREFNEIVEEARKLGYTEPNPQDDLSGEDVARKILILGRTAGFKLNYDDINLSPFVPFNVREGNVLRYVASINNRKHGEISVNVGLKEVPKDSSLGSLKGTSNKIIIITETYGPDSPYIVEAPGAGLEITAQNIRRDLLEQLKERVVS